MEDPGAWGVCTGLPALWSASRRSATPFCWAAAARCTNKNKEENARQRYRQKIFPVIRKELTTEDSDQADAMPCLADRQFPCPSSPSELPSFMSSPPPQPPWPPTQGADRHSAQAHPMPVLFRSGLALGSCSLGRLTALSRTHPRHTYLVVICAMCCCL